MSISARVNTITAELHSIMADRPWDLIGVDMVGPFTKTDSGNVYICTMTDLFTKFVYAKSVKVLPTFNYLYTVKHATRAICLPIKLNWPNPGWVGSLSTR